MADTQKRRRGGSHARAVLNYQGVGWGRDADGGKIKTGNAGSIIEVQERSWGGRGKGRGICDLAKGGVVWVTFQTEGRETRVGVDS